MSYRGNANITVKLQTRARRYLHRHLQGPRM